MQEFVLLLSKTVDGTDGNKWYYMGLQIDGNRVFRLYAGFCHCTSVQEYRESRSQKRTAAIILPGVHQEQQREASQPEPVWQSEELQLILMEKNGE